MKNQSKTKKFLIFTLLPTFFIFLSGCGSSATFSDKKLAIYKAERLFNELKSAGENFEKGPCLSEEIIKDWSVDIAHDPRNADDILAENNCQNYLTKKTKHLIELDIRGAFLNAK